MTAHISPRAAEHLRLFLGVPAALLAMVGVLKLVAGLFGIEVFSISRKFDEHVVYSRGYHHAVDSVLKHHEQDDAADREILEGIARGECLENPRSNLMRQGLMRKCRELGVQPGQ